MAQQQSTVDLAKLPPRFVLSGMVLNVFQAPAGKSKDGRDYGGDFRLQVLSADHLRNGETKVVPTEVSIGGDAKEAETYRTRVGAVVQLPVSVYMGAMGLAVTLAADRKAP
jgi:hypothetical protein